MNIIEGKLIKKFDLKKIGKLGFIVQDFVLEHENDQNYKSTHQFQAIKAAVNYLSHITEGDYVIVFYKLGGRFVDNGDKHYNISECYKIQVR